MSPGPPPPPRLLRDVREGYPRLSGSGGRGRLRPHATWGRAGQAAGWLDCRVCRGRDRRPLHTCAPLPRPCHPSRRTPAPRPPLLLSRGSPHRPLPQLTPTHPDPQRQARPSVAGHQTGSSRVQDGDSAPTPSALLAGSGRPLTRRARSRGPAKNSQARLYLVWPDPHAATRTAPHPAPPGEPRPAQR